MPAAATPRRAGPGRARRRLPARGSPLPRAGPATPGGKAAFARDAERLQKILSRAGIASRREVEAWIRAGRLSVNGQPAALGARVRAGDRILLDGRVVHTGESATRARVFLCHRSPGEPLSETDDDRPQRTLRPALLERLPRRSGRRFVAVSPMPRADGGLELVTSDGELAARLQRAVHVLASEFGVRVRGDLAEDQVRAILQGTLERGTQLEILRCESAGGEAANRWYTVAALGTSGKQVRQLFERQGLLVSRVLRTRLGPLSLERSLKRGQFREVTPEELGALLSAVR